MHKGLRAITAGVVSTTVMVIALLVVEVETRSRLLLFEAVARFFGTPNQVGLGLLIFVFFGVIVWPLLFSLVHSYLPPNDDPVVEGMVFSTFLWVLFLLIGTAEMDAILVLFYLVLTLLVHLTYGFTLGLLYGWITPTPAPSVTNNKA